MKKYKLRIIAALLASLFALAGTAYATLVDDNPVSATNPMPSHSVDSNGASVYDVVPSVNVTDIDHYIIHVGRSFIYSDALSVAAAGGADTVNFVILNATDNEVHLKAFRFTSSQGNAELTMYHQVTSDAGTGTLANLHNMNFDSANLSTAEIRVDPTNVVIGAAEHQVQHFLIVGGKQSGGTADSGGEEYVLKQNEKVLLQYVNKSNQVDTYSFKIILLDVGLL